MNSDKKIIAEATRVGSLYYLECKQNPQQLSVIEKESKHRLWYRQHGHLNERSLQQLANKDLVECFDYKTTNNIGFCETCVEHWSHFKISSSKSKEPLELAYSDVCGKMNKKSLEGAEYLLIFIDDKT